MHLTDAPLVERDLELRALDQLLGRARQGEGAAMLVEGPAGIGKSRLLAEARARAEGFRVVAARGSQLEHSFPFGVVRQLFEPVLAAAGPAGRESLLTGAAALAEAVLTGRGDGDESEFAALHGLYWLVVNVAEASPLLVVVDDVHWSDAASLRWLVYLARRLEGLPVALLAAGRPPEAVEDPRLLVELAVTPGLEIVRPGGLTERAIAGIVVHDLERPADGAFVGACMRATSGNPFLLRQLLGEVSRAAAAPARDAVGLVERLGSRDVARMVFARLADLPSGAAGLARAVAVLGDGVPVASAARLAALTEEDTLRLADRLAAVDILRRGLPLAFVHPLVRTSVYGEIGGAELSRLHARAASMLLAEGAGDERVALHLLACTPAGDAGRVDVLRRAAAMAGKRGAADVAVSYLRRAAEELPGEPPPELGVELGRAALRAGEVDLAIAQLRAARRELGSTTDLARVTNTLATALSGAARYEEAVGELDATLARLTEADRDAGLRLQAARWAVARGSAEAWAAARRTPERFAPAEEPFALASAAFHATREGTAAEARELALRALGTPAGFPELGLEQSGSWLAPISLVWADAQEEAVLAYGAAIEWATRHGSLPILSIATDWRAYASWCRGALDDAEADAGDTMERDVFPRSSLWAIAALAGVFLERGRVADAEEHLARAPADPRSGWGALSLLQARARVRFAAGRPDDALADLTACGRLEDELEIRTPSNTSWRAEAALVLSSLGRNGEAHDLAREEVERSRRYGALRPLGIALRSLGSISDGADGLDLLAEAADVHGRSQARLEHARSLGALGAALRRAGRRPDARDALRAALEIALRCGASTIALRAHDELVAAGAKPRRDPIESRHALTASELRVARLAVDGLTNRQIAQALFLTEKTIEVHLTRVYRKLDIASRTQLARALPASDKELVRRS